MPNDPLMITDPQSRASRANILGIFSGYTHVVFTDII